METLQNHFIFFFFFLLISFFGKILPVKKLSGFQTSVVGQLILDTGSDPPASLSGRFLGLVTAVVKKSNTWFWCIKNPNSQIKNFEKPNNQPRKPPVLYQLFYENLTGSNCQLVRKYI